LLSDEGRNEARAIGDTFRRLGIPVGRVLTSAWCRTRETADLAFGKGQVARDKVWDTGYLDDGSSRRKGYRDALRGLLGEVPGGGNTVIVGHMPQLYDATGIQLEESEAALFRPKGGGYDVLVQRVAPGGWDGLAGR
jgi:phosphohistidine phosphatase SixA